MFFRNAGFNWGIAISRNKALFLIYFFLALSAFWSELPFVSLKRLIKDFGCVPVALVILTELDPITAFRTIFVRVSYLLFPLSIVFIKYFPGIGRQSAHSGENMFTGVTTQKNSLGEMVFVLSIVLLWDFLEIRKTEKSKERKLQLRIRIGMLAMGVWLLMTCDSQTSVVCLIIGHDPVLADWRIAALEDRQACARWNFDGRDRACDGRQDL